MRTLMMLVLALSGCSAIAVRGPNSPDEPGKCSASYAAPVVDGVLGAGGIIGGAIAASADEPESDTHIPSFRKLGGGLAIFTGVVYAVSAVAGASTVHACKVARDASRDQFATSR